jgi:uncharacterized glyoxalase superfamily protein PhnB
VRNDPGVQKAVPMLSYEDAAAAIDFLTRAFGFRERVRLEGEDGRIGHAELVLGDALIMLANPHPGYVSPRRLREESDAARRSYDVPWVIDGVLVYVDDVDANFARARDAGATILSEPMDVPPAGIRHYRAEDPEGHRWMIASPLTS